MKKIVMIAIGMGIIFAGILDDYFFLCSGHSKMMYDKKSGDIKETAYEGVKKVPRDVFFSKIKKHKKDKK